MKRLYRRQILTLKIATVLSWKNENKRHQTALELRESIYLLYMVIHANKIARGWSLMAEDVTTFYYIMQGDVQMLFYHTVFGF